MNRLILLLLLALAGCDMIEESVDYSGPTGSTVCHKNVWGTTVRCVEH